MPIRVNVGEVEIVNGTETTKKIKGQMAEIMLANFNFILFFKLT